MKILLIILVFLSLAVGLPFGDKGWWFIWQVEFFDIPFGILKKGPFQVGLYLVIILSHLTVFMLPFLTKTSLFKKMLIIAPLTYLISFYIFLGYIVLIVFTPFIIVWIICLIKSYKLKYVKG